MILFLGWFDADVGSIIGISDWASRVWNISAGVQVCRLSEWQVLFCLPLEVVSSRILSYGCWHKAGLLFHL